MTIDYHPVGFLGDLVAYTSATAAYKNTPLAFAGAMSFLALLVSRRVRISNGIRPNIYMLALAKSGTGKEHARKINQKLIELTRRQHSLQNSFGSAEGLEEMLKTEAALLFQTDEFDSLIQSGSASDCDKISSGKISKLMELFSASGGVYRTRCLAKKQSIQIQNPALNIFGTAVPSIYYSSLNNRSLTGGLLARMIVIEADDRPVGVEAVEIPIPDSIKNFIEYWESSEKNSTTAGGVFPDERVLILSVAAREYIESIRATVDSDPWQKCNAAGDDVGMSVHARSLEKIYKFAMLHAISAEKTTRYIELESVTWAKNTIEILTMRMLTATACWSSASDYELEQKKILRLLRRHPHAGNWSKILHGSKLLGRDFASVIATMVESGLVSISDANDAKRSQKTITLRADDA